MSKNVNGSVVDSILRERELKNEKRVGVFRFFIFTIISFLDIMDFFGIIKYSSIPPTVTSILFDLVWVVYSVSILGLVLKNLNLKYLKFIIITFDYAFLTIILIFDPTIPKTGSIMVWIAFSAPLFWFFINLLRYSKEGTIYAAFNSVVLYVGILLYTDSYRDETALQIGVVLLMILFIGYSITKSNKEMMIEANTKKMMERYLPPQLISELYKENVSLEPGGKRQEVTILFSDIRSFTTISESMSAEDVVFFLNDYLSTMTEVIFHNEGTIDKFIGDAIMTTFGIPFKSQDDSYRAIKTAVEMKKALKDFNQRHKELKIPIEIGIGIHTGDVIAGNIGSDKRLDYTVIGDNVNLSARIEGLTKYYRCPILISQTTYKNLEIDKIKNDFLIREVDEVRVKGKSEYSKIYEVLSFQNEEEKVQQQNTIDTFLLGLQLYRERKFKEAIEQYSKNKEDGLSSLYLERCNFFLENPPNESWDGRFVMETK